MTFPARTLSSAFGTVPPYSGTMTSAAATAPPSYNWFGFDTFGILPGSSMSPPTLSNGIYIDSIYDEYISGGYSASSFVLGGFTADPSATYVHSVKCGSVTLLTSAASYSYSGGYAEWAWPSGSNPGWGLSGPSTYAVTIV